VKNVCECDEDWIGTYAPSLGYGVYNRYFSWPQNRTNTPCQYQLATYTPMIMAQIVGGPIFWAAGYLYLEITVPFLIYSAIALAISSGYAIFSNRKPFTNEELPGWTALNPTDRENYVKVSLCASFLKCFVLFTPALLVLWVVLSIQLGLDHYTDGFGMPLI
jgi:hypothetical protein